jgi:hypothetical protein
MAAQVYGGNRVETRVTDAPFAIHGAIGFSVGDRGDKSAVSRPPHQAGRKAGIASMFNQYMKGASHEHAASSPGARDRCGGNQR